MNSRAARITEIFSSLQGEGPYLGAKQIFIRFADCNLTCSYCDEGKTRRTNTGKSYSVRQLAAVIARLDKRRGPHEAISFTGGEPLLQADFLQKLLPLLKKNGHKIYLETNGTLARAYKRIARFVDVVAMDMKLPSMLGGQNHLNAHRDFLKEAVHKNVFVKIVYGPTTRLSEILACARIIACVSPKVLLVLQPQSAAGQRQAKDLIERACDTFYPKLAAILKNVRVIGQMHKVWGVR